MESSLGFQTWAIAIYLLATSLKGVSSMKLPLTWATQKSAWPRTDSASVGNRALYSLAL